MPARCSPPSPDSPRSPSVRSKGTARERFADRRICHIETKSERRRMSARSTKGRTMARGTRGARAPRLKPGVKREQILEVAIEAFGRDGYEETKWADIAATVDIGST